MPLTDDEVKLIGTHFQRNYEQGERVQIPDELIGDPNNWLADQMVFRQGRFPMADDLYSPDKHKPRISLREETGAGDYLESKMKEVGEKGTVSLDIDAFRFDYEGDEDARPVNLLSIGHHEFKVWLQQKIEKISRGEGSPRFLANREEDRGSETVSYTHLRAHET